MQNEIKYLSCYTGIIEDNKLYTVNMYLGILLEYDLKNFSYQVLTRIPLRDRAQLVRVIKMIKIGSVFYFIFENTRIVWMYDMSSKESDMIENGEDVADRYLVNSDAYRWKDCIFLTPERHSETIGVFNWRTNKFDEDIPLGHFSDSSGKVRITKIGIMDRKIWYTFFGAPVLIGIDVESRGEKHWIIDPSKNILAVSLSEGYFWILLSGAELIKWNPEEGIIKKYVLDSLRINEEKPVFRHLYETDTYVYIVPYYAQCIWKIDKSTEEVFSIKYPSELKRVHPNFERCLFFEVLKDGDNLFLLPFAVNVLVQLDMNDGRMTYHECSFNRQEIWKYYCQDILGKNALSEDEIIDLSFFVEKIKILNTWNERTNENQKIGIGIMAEVE